MSRARKARAKKRLAAALPGSAAPAAGRIETRRASSDSRVEPARRRASVAKATLGAGGALVFGAAMLFARVSYAGRPKRPPRPLAAPPRFVSIARENLLQAGIVAPAQAPRTMSIVLRAFGASEAPRKTAPADLGEQYVHVCQRNVDGQVVRGTKSRRYPDKDVYLLGPLPATMARRATAAGLDDVLFPYPGTNRLWTESEYRNWREDYFVPVARSHGLSSESDDPYALRHIYATLRIAAQHPTLYIESSMGTGLVGKVYGGVIRRYEGKGPLNIDAEIEAARNAAPAKRRRLRTA